LMQDALALFNQQPPIVFHHDKVTRHCGDMDGIAEGVVCYLFAHWV
jgi:hypothetical protein